MAATLSRIDNLVPNPSAEVNTNGMGSASGTLTRVTDWAWAGIASFNFVTTNGVAGGTVQTTGASGDALRVLATVGATYSGRVVARVPTLVANRKFRLGIWFYNSGGTLIDQTNFVDTTITAANTNYILKIEGAVAPANTAYMAIVLQYLPTTGTLGAETFKADGFQINPGVNADAYVDGSLGAHHFWTGTAHASASYREAIAFQQTIYQRGVTRVSAKLWLADVNNVKLKEITSTAIDAKVSMNIHNDIKTSFVMTGLDSDEIEPYVGMLAPYLILEEGNNEPIEYQLGLFITTPPKKQHHQTVTLTAIEGRDLTWILANDYFGAIYNVAAGVNPIVQARTIIDGVGLRHSIPSYGATLPTARSWSVEKSKLQIVNDLLNGAGYYTLWADRGGVLKSTPYFELATAEPSLQLFSGEGGQVLDVIEQEGVYERITNFVVVYKENTAGAPIVATRTNNDPASPVSTVNMNGRKLPLVVQDTNLVSVTEAKALAKRLIEEGASFTNKLRITTKALPDRDMHEVYDMAVYNREGKPIGFGLWWCDAYEIGFTTKAAKMVHYVKRLEPFGWDETP